MKVTQHKKKYLLNCSMRVYERIIKLKYRGSRYLSRFSSNRPTCLYKSKTHVSNYCKFQLSADLKKNPGPTPMYTDPSKTITAPFSQANALVFGQNSGQQCVNTSIYGMTCMIDGNFGNVSAGVLFSKVAYQRKR